MRKVSNMIFKKIVLTFCFLYAVIISSCSFGDGDVTLTYTFDNKSSYIIRIILFNPYKEDEASEVEYTSPFLVYGGNEKAVLVKRNNVNFSWTTNYASDNPKVYCEVNGQKATFRNVKER